MVGAQAYQESGLDQSGKSHAGAVGVMQLLPSTAADRNVNLSVAETLDNAPAVNPVKTGIHILRRGVDSSFHGNDRRS